MQRLSNQNSSTRLFLYGNDMLWLIKNTLASFLLPPLNCILLLLLGLACLYHGLIRFAKWLLCTGTFALYWLATPWVAGLLVHGLEVPPLRDMKAASSASAIVVLGGGALLNQPEYARDVSSHATLQRLRYAAMLHKKTGLPILVSGGSPAGGEAEALCMQRDLQTLFEVPVRWVEARSDNTDENARYSYQMLQQTMSVKASPHKSLHQAQIKILLVTHSWHMPRAQRLFVTAGFDVIAAPTVFAEQNPLRLLDFLPSAGALEGSRVALHEWLGLLWYRFKLETTLHQWLDKSTVVLSLRI